MDIRPFALALAAAVGLATSAPAQQAPAPAAPQVSTMPTAQAAPEERARI